ncbi:MAG: S41 family peptidase [candidate division WS1 bacterium]|jgi:carboxyl-terminal processing protease|nr:S41 family peptidase [candidate division WS1 bacterium]
MATPYPDSRPRGGQSLRSWSIVAAITLATLLVFATGMFTAQVISSGGIVPALVEMAQIVPGVHNIENGTDIPSATNLTPLKTFWRARQRIIDNFVHPEDIEQSELTYGAIEGMLESLGDPYSRFMSPEEYAEFQTQSEGSFEGIGAELVMEKNEESGEDEVIVLRVLPEGPAAKTSLFAGDVIVGVDGTSVRGMSLNDVVKLIRGVGGTDVTLNVRHENGTEITDVVITRGRVEFPIVDYRMLEGDIGYIWLRSFNHMAEAEVQEALNALKQQGMKGLLFDLSSDPGGMLDQAVAVASLFLDDTPVTWIKNRMGEPEPLRARPGIMLDESVPMVVLIDRGSASASEIVAGALQDTGRATVCGDRSYGKAKVQTVIELEDGSAMVLTTAVYLTPNQRDISEENEEGERGVCPDVLFPKFPADVAVEDRPSVSEWHDEQIERAATILREKLTAQAGG